MSKLTADDRWLLSFYRTSEIGGALFFGRIARTAIAGPLQADLTHHFADEANHARYWTDCMADLDVRPMKVKGAYQDQYLEAAGLPANLMEVLAITQVFERRAIWAYRRHLTWAPTHPRVRQTLEQIMADERWHLRYVRDALRGMAPRYGADAVDDALARCAKADGEVYELAVAEHRGSFPFLEEQP